MSVLLPLLRVYQNAGFQVRTGLNPVFFNNDIDVVCTALYKDGQRLSTGGGISLQEVYFFDILFSIWHPQRIFGVGCAFGWSTIMLAMLNPSANVVVLDAGMEGQDARRGLDLTNRLAQQEGLRARAVYGWSPQDVPACITANLDGPIDFVFIDGLHTNEQQWKDYQAILPYVTANCVFVFHDVICMNMVASFQQIAATETRLARILWRTPTGMGVLSPAALEPQIGEVLEAFCQTPF